MRQREEQELSAEVRRELDALDRALAGEPVDAEFDAVATLARELREQRPLPEEGFAARLDERADEDFATDGGAPASPFADRVREWLAGVRPMRLLAPAGAVATIVVVASVAVIQSGDGGTDATTPAETTSIDAGGEGRQGAGGAAGAAQPTSPEPLSGAEDAGGAAENYSLEPPSGVAEESAGLDQFQGSGPGADREQVAPGSEREEERSATLDLSTDEDEFEDVADGVVEITDRYEGFVISSQESTSGESARATFELEIPSDQLDQALTDLSELAHVEARSEDALDITAPTVNARQRLTDARTEVRGLLSQLENAETPEETDEIRSRLDIARAEAAQAKAEFQKLARRANYADVRVTVSSDGQGDGDWGVDEAIDDLGDALSTAGGIALISAAILMPIGLVIALIGLAWRRSVRRGRERALGE